MKSPSATEVADALECYRMKSERQRKNCKNKSCPYNNNDSYYGCYCCSNSILCDAIVLLKEQEVKEQISDVIHEMAKPFRRQIVMCKDCKHSKRYGAGEGNYLYGCEFGNGLHNEDWFCADGKRRDG